MVMEGARYRVDGQVLNSPACLNLWTTDSMKRAVLLSAGREVTTGSKLLIGGLSCVMT